MACKDCGKKTMMIMSIISLVLGFLCLILSIVMIATISSDFVTKYGGKEYDLCEMSKSGGSKSRKDPDSYPEPKEQSSRHYIPGTCFSKSNKMDPDVVCECRNGRYGASALLMLTSLGQIAGSVVLLLSVLSVIMKEKPLKFKWLIFLALHVALLVLLLIASIISSVFRMSEDEAELYARRALDSATQNPYGKKRQYVPPAPESSHPNIEGKMFAFFNGLDFCFCVACVIVAALTFCKCGKCLLDEGEQGPNPNGNQNPNQSGFASQKPSTAATEQSKPKSRPSTPAPEKSSTKTNASASNSASASTRQSKRDVAGDKKK